MPQCLCKWKLDIMLVSNEVFPIQTLCWFNLCQYKRSRVMKYPFCGFRYRTNSRLAPSQWETSLQSNAVSHWVGSKPRISPVDRFDLLRAANPSGSCRAVWIFIAHSCIRGVNLVIDLFICRQLSSPSGLYLEPERFGKYDIVILCSNLVTISSGNGLSPTPIQHLTYFQLSLMPQSHHTTAPVRAVRVHANNKSSVMTGTFIWEM